MTSTAPAHPRMTARLGLAASTEGVADRADLVADKGVSADEVVAPVATAAVEVKVEMEEEGMDLEGGLEEEELEGGQASERAEERDSTSSGLHRDVFGFRTGSMEEDAVVDLEAAARAVVQVGVEAVGARAVAMVAGKVVEAKVGEREEVVRAEDRVEARAEAARAEEKEEDLVWAAVGMEGEAKAEEMKEQGGAACVRRLKELPVVAHSDLKLVLCTVLSQQEVYPSDRSTPTTELPSSTLGQNGPLAGVGRYRRTFRSNRSVARGRDRR